MTRSAPLALVLLALSLAACPKSDTQTPTTDEGPAEGDSETGKPDV